MPENGRRDLILRLKVKFVHQAMSVHVPELMYRRKLSIEKFR